MAAFFYLRSDLKFRKLVFPKPFFISLTRKAAFQAGWLRHFSNWEKVTKSDQKHVSLEKWLIMIHFVNRIDDIPEYPLSRTILIDDSLQSEREVIDRIELALDSPYDRDNWDGFYDALRDLQWLNESQVVLIHKSLPRLTSWDLHIYLDILEEIDKPTDSTVDFEVYFIVDDKTRIDFFLPGKFPLPEAKSKRAPATYIGDIFEIPLPGYRKRYMQFILVDSSQLGAWTVRVFKTDYQIDDKPSIDEILNDRIDFYMNTRDLGGGILYGLWSRYANSDNLGDLNKVVFRCYQDGFGLYSHRWWVWKSAQPVVVHRFLPRKYLEAPEGGMFPPFSVISRIMTGRWYMFKNLYYDYKDASLIDRIRIRGIGKITDEYIVPKRPPKK